MADKGVPAGVWWVGAYGVTERRRRARQGLYRRAVVSAGIGAASELASELASDD